MLPAPTDQLLHSAYRADLGVLVSRWGYQPDPALLPPVYDELTAAALGCGCRYWLQDIRRRTLNDPAITQWLLSTYFPQMAQRLGGQLAVAYLTSPLLMDHIVNGPGFLPPEGYAEHPFVIAFFGDEGEAIRWLAAEQQRSR